MLPEPGARIRPIRLLHVCLVSIDSLTGLFPHAPF